ncbi:unnamed protein product, partial [Candidula unifasciata]
MMTKQINSSVSELLIAAVSDNIEPDALINQRVVVIIQWIFFSVLCQIIDVAGIGANIINIICFVKQGCKDPVNVSLI